MPVTKPMTSIETKRKGRPANCWKKATNLIGVTGVAALKSADLYIIPGNLARELSLIVGDPMPEAKEPTPNVH